MRPFLSFYMLIIVSDRIIPGHTLHQLISIFWPLVLRHQILKKEHLHNLITNPVYLEPTQFQHSK